MRKFAVALLLLAAPLWAAPPAVEVPATVKVNSGEWVIIVAKTDAKSVKFVPLTPGLKQFPPQLVSDPKTFAAQAPDGVYRLLVYSGNADGPSDPVYSVITIGSAGPPPIDPSRPEGALGLVKVSRDAMAKVNVPDRAGEARKLAAGYRRTAVTLPTPAEEGPLALANAVAAACRTANNAAGVTAEAWKPWGQTVADALTVLYNAGRLKTPADWSAALVEIAQGLEGQ